MKEFTKWFCPDCQFSLKELGDGRLHCHSCETTWQRELVTSVFKDCETEELLKIADAAKAFVDETERIEREQDYCCSTCHQYRDMERNLENALKK